MAQKIIDVNVTSDDKAFTQTLTDKLKKIQQSDLTYDIHQMRNRLTELETSNKILENKLSEIADVASVGPDNRLIELEMKFRQLETEKSELEYLINLIKSEQVENIDKLVDNIRKLSAQNAELDVHVRTLKTKVPHLEDITRKQETNIETIKQKYNDSTYDKIKEMEKTVAFLEDGNKKLEELIAKLSDKQGQMTDEAEQKMKQSFEQKLELESKITKLKGKVKDMERINTDLQNRLEEMKSKAVEAAESDKQKTVKINSDMETMNEQLKEVVEEKTRAEKENAILRKEMKIMKVKLVAYEKEL